jgi:hypothetical protein
MPDVTQIKFEMVVDGKRREAIFVRQEKIQDLLDDPESLGAFLHDLRHAPPPPRSVEVSTEDDSKIAAADPYAAQRALDDWAAAVWARPNFQFENTIDAFRALANQMGSLPAALACLLAASHICLDDGQDELEFLKAARTAFKRALEERADNAS